MEAEQKETIEAERMEAGRIEYIGAELTLDEQIKIFSEKVDKAIAEHGLEVVKLNPKRGEILLLKAKGELADDIKQQYLESMRRFLNACGYQGVRLLLIDSTLEIETLDVARMAAYGWVRRKV